MCMGPFGDASLNSNVMVLLSAACNLFSNLIK